MDDKTNIPSDDYIESGGKRDGATKQDLIIEVWRKVVNARAQEMRRGYFNSKADKFGNVTKQWIPDTREQYFNALRSFDLLLTEDEISSDHMKAYEDAKKKYNKDAETAFNKYGWKKFKVLRTPIPNAYNKFIYSKKFTKDIIMPEATADRNNIGSYTKVAELNTSTGKLYAMSWDENQHQFMEELMIITDKFYHSIVILMAKSGYSTGGSGDIDDSGGWD